MAPSNFFPFNFVPFDFITPYTIPPFEFGPSEMIGLVIGPLKFSTTPVPKLKGDQKLNEQGKVNYHHIDFLQFGNQALKLALTYEQ